MNTPALQPTATACVAEPDLESYSRLLVLVFVASPTV